MGNQEISSVGGHGIPLVSRGLMLALAVGLAFGQGIPAGAARTPSDPRPAAVPDRLSFDVASVKPDNSAEDPDSNFPLGAGDVYTPNGGFFSATNFPLVTYIAFAYKLRVDQTSYLLSGLPEWTSNERFDIQARCGGNPSKDEMRLMMRSLLADRFKLVVQHETRQLPVLEVVLAKPIKTGPQLQPHSNDWPCPSRLPSPSTAGRSPTQPPARAFPGGLPPLCKGIFQLPSSAPGLFHVGARNVTVQFIADYFSGVSSCGRQFLDRTGLGGNVDFNLEWKREYDGPAPPGVKSPPDMPGPTFQAALREQLGLRLQAQKAPIDVIVIDHVEHPSGN
jgi:uncharacterized protein (TIGR03435 family)